ncbi:hypothetical protein BH20BAC1_BH20BAC1_23580 [soil metagenome]
MHISLKRKSKAYSGLAPYNDTHAWRTKKSLILNPAFLAGRKIQKGICNKRRLEQRAGNPASLPNKYSQKEYNHSNKLVGRVNLKKNICTIFSPGFDIQKFIDLVKFNMNNYPGCFHRI